MAPERKIPAFARRTFRSWWRRRRSGVPPAASPVLLFADTFNKFFQPGTARAAVEVLEAAGFRVTVPGPVLCCGRPFYDYGMLGLARHALEKILTALKEEIRAGIPMVVLEPSCAAVFRDELPALFPVDEDARRLSAQTHVLSELLRRKAPGYRPPLLSRRAIVQAHCHQQAILRTADEEELLHQMGLEVTMLDSGCCGMAGAFGFEKEHYDISVAVGERALLPAVRRADADTLIVADGFSCREQIRGLAGRSALHLADVIGLGLTGPGPSP
jgi:Fe-S oxidoreductase